MRKLYSLFFILEYFELNIEFNSTYVHMGERKFRRTEVSPKRVFCVFVTISKSVSISGGYGLISLR